MLITKYAVKMRTAVIVGTVAVSILGSLAYFKLMPREGPPDITIPYVFVIAAYEGVAPTEIENLITIPLERKLKDLENVKEIRSVSAEGVSSITIEFTPKEDLNNALQRVKDKLDLARPDLPQDLKQPMIDVINFSTFMPIISMALSGDVPVERLRKVAEDLQDSIERLEGIKQASIVGARQREIRVEVDPVRLAEYKIPLHTLIGAISSENRNISAGNLEMKSGKFQVRIPGEFGLVSDMKKLVLVVRDGQPIYLTDVATIEDSFKDLDSISRLNKKPCVSIHVTKRSGENTISLIKKVDGIVKGMVLPPEIKLTTTMDQSEFIVSMVEELENGIVTGSILVFIVLLVSIGWRNSLFVGLAIPLSMFIAFVAFSGRDITLNMLVLFGLVMVTGMLVDDAVVIVENIFRNRSMGMSKADAAVKGAAEVAWPVTTSTITAALACWPLLYWPDLMGQFMRYLPLTLIVARSASLLVALIINPALCSFYITPEKVSHDARGAARHPVLDAYESFLRGIMGHRGLVVTVGVLLSVLTVLMYGRFSKGVEFMPKVEPRSASVLVKFPQGTPIEKTSAAVESIEEKLLKYKDIKFFLANVGVSADGQSKGSGLGNIAIEFKTLEAEDPAERRTTNTIALVDEIRKEIGQIPGAVVKVTKTEHGPPVGAPVSVEISGDDFDVLSDLSRKVVRILRNVPSVVDVENQMEEAMPEFQFKADRQRMALLGANTEMVGNYLRSSIFGLEVSKYRAGDDEYEIRIRLPPGARNSADMLTSIYIPIDDKKSVPLTSLGTIAYTGGKGNIMRVDNRRVITITGDTEVDRNIDAVMADVKTAVGAIELPPGYSISYTGQNKEMNQAFDFLIKAFGIGIALIAIVLVMEFNSVVLPLIILVTVVMAMLGVMSGLLIFRMPFGVIMTGLGIITLAGVVTNNGIVLIDCIQHKRASGMSGMDAAIAGGRQRLRPVLLTAIAAILGLIPMAVGWSLQIHHWPWRIVQGTESAQWWAPMAISVICGLTVATVLTLVFVPVLYSLAIQFTDWLKGKFASSLRD